MEVKMLTTGEVARLFHVSAQTVINWLDQGRISFERIGRGPRRLTEQKVLEYIKETGISPEALEQTIYRRLIVSRNVNEPTISKAVVVCYKTGAVLMMNKDAHSLFQNVGYIPGEDSVDKLNLQISTGQALSDIIKLPLRENFKSYVANRKSHGHESLSLTISAFFNISGEEEGKVLVLRPV
jgi:excisionase family DNA binding protein